MHAHLNNDFTSTIRECSGSVVERLTRDQESVGLSLTGVTALWSLSKTYLSSLVLIQPRKTRSCLTERLMMGRLASKQTNHVYEISPIYFDLKSKIFRMHFNVNNIYSQPKLRNDFTALLASPNIYAHLYL